MNDTKRKRRMKLLNKFIELLEKLEKEVSESPQSEFVQKERELLVALGACSPDGTVCKPYR